MARPRRRSNRPIQKKGPEHRINERIRVPEVRLVGDNVEQGVYKTSEALKIAYKLSLDLVEIAAKAHPPVCRIIDYSKFLYEKKRKEKEIKAKAQKTIVKEIRFTPNTDDHDFEFKSKHAERFLEEGAKVKAYVQFKGRAIVFKERGELLLLKFAERLSELGALEQMPRLEGKRMFAFISPKKAPKKKAEKVKHSTVGDKPKPEKPETKEKFLKAREAVLNEVEEEAKERPARKERVPKRYIKRKTKPSSGEPRRPEYKRRDRDRDRDKNTD